MEISLTSFIDFVMKSGSPKMTCAKKIQLDQIEPYSPLTDYYKRFREAIVKVHQLGHSKGKIASMIGKIPDNKKGNYRAMITGYEKFWGSKDIKWFEPLHKKWYHSTTVVPINPELGLEWSGKKYIIKMYLKSDKPSKDRISTVLALMHECLKPHNCELALLDVRNSKLYIYEDSMSSLMPLVKGEVVNLEFLIKSFI